MQFVPTPLSGSWIVETDPIADHRGFFARTFCRDGFRAHSLNPDIAQCNISFNRRAGTLRGLHYQAAPHEEDKLVLCTQGSVFDVIVDLRPGSPTRGRWFSLEMAPSAGKMLYVPAGFGHGFQTLVDDSAVFYQMSEVHHPELARGIRWDDPTLGIPWPMANPILSPRDAALPLLVDEAATGKATGAESRLKMDRWEAP